MITKDIQLVTKDIQKIVLKTICEHPTFSIEELALHLKTIDKPLSQEEIIQVLLCISPDKNWHRASSEEVRKEILNYLWTLETQILFIFPVKQKETTLAEFNQLRLRNKQPKASKDLVRHVQSLLLVDGKNLSKFRRFEKELNILEDVDTTTQATWAIRIICGTAEFHSLRTIHDLPSLLTDKLNERFPMLAEKVGKTMQRITERFIERYFTNDLTESQLKQNLSDFQSIYRAYKEGAGSETTTQQEFQDQNKLIQNIVNELTKIETIIHDSHEGGFVSKLVSGKVKNREGIVAIVHTSIKSLSQLIDLNNEMNRASIEKSLLVQKLQSDYENVLIAKNQLESDLHNIKEELKLAQEKSTNYEKELQDKTEQLTKTHERVTSLQQDVEQISEQEAKEKMLRDELHTAKDIALRLYRRVQRIKVDLHKLNEEKSKSTVRVISPEHKLSQPLSSVSIPVTNSIEEKSVNDLPITPDDSNSQ